MLIFFLLLRNPWFLLENSKYEKGQCGTLMKWKLSYERNKSGINSVERRKARFHFEQKRLQNWKQRLSCTGKDADWRQKVPMQHLVCGNRLKT